MCGALSERADLVDELSAVSVVGQEDDGPQLRILSANKVARLALEQRVIVAHLQKKGGENLSFAEGKRETSNHT